MHILLLQHLQCWMDLSLVCKFWLSGVLPVAFTKLKMRLTSAVLHLLIACFPSLSRSPAALLSFPPLSLLSLFLHLRAFCLFLSTDWLPVCYWSGGDAPHLLNWGKKGEEEEERDSNREREREAPVTSSIPSLIIFT